MIAEGDIATVHIVEGILAACGSYGIDVRRKLLGELTPSDFGPCTLPLFVRCADPVLPCWTASLVESSRPYLYYLDDNFWKLSGGSSIARYYRRPLIRRSLETTIAGATGVLAHARELLPLLLAINSNTKIVPPSFDFGLIEGVVPEQTNELRIGFAGSSSRWLDLEIIAPIMNRVLDLHPQVVFEFAGVLPRSVPTTSRIRLFPHTPDYESFVRFQASRAWSLGLAPLHDTEANRCKTDNKYREYAACRIAGIYSGIPPYAGSVVPGVTGLLVENDPEAWFQAAKRLLSDPAERSRIGNAARDDVYSRYRISTVAPQWATCIQKTSPRPPYPPLRLAAGFRARRIYAHVRHLGVQLQAVYGEGGVPLALNRIRAGLRQALTGRP
jgi:glycosyltransferase involved in cell wall biosynthesis